MNDLKAAAPYVLAGFLLDRDPSSEDLSKLLGWPVERIEKLFKKTPRSRGIWRKPHHADTYARRCIENVKLLMPLVHGGVEPAMAEKLLKLPSARKEDAAYQKKLHARLAEVFG